MTVYKLNRLYRSFNKRTIDEAQKTYRDYKSVHVANGGTAERQRQKWTVLTTTRHEPIVILNVAQVVGSGGGNR